MGKQKRLLRVGLSKAIKKNNIAKVQQILSSNKLELCDERYSDYYLVILALQESQIDIVNLFIDKGFRLFNMMEYENTILHYAVQLDNSDLVKKLLAKEAARDILTLNKENKTPLHLAIDRNQLEYTKLFLSLCDSSSLDEKLLLHYSVEQDRISVVLQLIEKGLSMKIKNQENSTPFCIAIKQNNFKILDCLLSNYKVWNVNLTDHDDVAPVFIACLYNKLNLIKKYLNCGLPINSFLNLNPDTCSCLQDYSGFTLLHFAVKNDNMEVIKFLLSKDADINIQDENGNTPVHLAFEQQNYRIIDLLLTVQNIAKSNPINNEGVSYFHIACTRNNINVVRKFIDSGVSVNACVSLQSDGDDHSETENWNDFSPLHFAVAFNKAKIVKLLLQNGANVGIKESNGYIPLHLAGQIQCEMYREFIETKLQNLSKYGKIDWLSTRKDHLKIVDLLLNYKSDVNCVDKEGNSPIYYAYSTGCGIETTLKKKVYFETLTAQIMKSLSEELCKKRILILNSLLKYNVNLDRCFQNNSSILHCVCRSDDKQNDEMIDLFLKHGANVNAKDYRKDGMIRTPLAVAALNQNPHLVKLLLKYNPDLDCIIATDFNSTILLAVSLMPSLIQSGIIELLIDGGANVKVKLINGRTALHNLATLSNDEESLLPIDVLDPLVSRLITAGANIDSQDKDGRTPFHIAFFKRNYAFAECLLKHGADVEIELPEGINICDCLHGMILRSLQLNLSMEPLAKLVNVMQTYVIKMDAIGLLNNDKLVRSIAISSLNLPIASGIQTDLEKKELVDDCMKEIQILRGSKIHDRCKLYDTIFKSENALSELINNRQFKTIVQSKSYEKKFKNYGYLVKLKYQVGMERRKLLPTAKFLLNKLAKLSLPDVCSENICKYFTNAELKDSTDILSSLFNFEIEKSVKRQLRNKTIKRQKVN